MSSNFDPSALLSEDEEPTHSLYHSAIETVVRSPSYIKRLTEALVHLPTRGNRLARFFAGLHRSVRTESRSSTTLNLATETANFLTSILPDVGRHLEPTKILEFLVPSLDVCFAPSQPPALRKLATALEECGTLLEHLASNHSGSRIVRQWAYLPSTLALDVATQEAWTERLVDMVSSCPGYHNVAPSLQQWTTLIALKDALQVLEVKLLEEEDKRNYLTVPPKSQSLFFPLDEKLEAMLKSFDLTIPESRRMVQSHIKTLKTDRVTVIFRSVAISFPCKRCIPALGSTPRILNAQSEDQSTAVIPNLHLDVLGAGVGVWKVHLSGLVRKSVAELSKLRLFGPVRDRLIDLGSGYFKCSLAGCDDQKHRLKVPLGSTKCGKDLSILWQVGIGTAEDMVHLQQVIIIWEVGSTKSIGEAINRVICIQGGYTDEDIHRCCQRPPFCNGKHNPMLLESHPLQLAGKGKPSPVIDVRDLDQDTIDMASKFYALTEPVIHSILNNDLAAEFPFDLSLEEARVFTHFKTTSLILGRSGTGKSTCLVYKMVGRFLASKAVLDKRSAQQVLLTRSSNLSDKHQTYTRRLIETSSSKSSSSDSFEFEEHLPPRTIAEDYESTSVLTLHDQSYPLICTFDRFLTILENTIKEIDRQYFQDLYRHQTHDIPSTKHPHSRRLVDFYTFKIDYWPRFSETLKKELSVNLVFADIIGVIKGSVLSYESLGPISREEYMARSCRAAPVFASEHERSCVYDIFGVYEKMKTEKGDIDDVDRVVRILSAVRRDPSLRELLLSTFDEIYVDEVQDQRCLDIELFFSIVKDGRGLHFAGDTAQAITHDSTFRFSDIKTLFHNHFAVGSETTKKGELPEPKMFTLLKNYRSHQGILALASMVMGMIRNGFPDSVDGSDSEVGVFSGPKPVLFLGCGVDILRTSNIDSNKRSERAANFGAEQVILVRDTKTKINLQDQIGHVALILTIPESKGMEFEDVLLWNFFSECPSQAGVRSLNALKNGKDGFDQKKHGGMCSELKHLYVAVTRARSRLFVIESLEPIATPVLKLFTEGSSGPLVEVTRPNDKDFALRVEGLRPISSVDAASWSQRADELMREKMFKDAQMAFSRAGDTQGETKAPGFLKEEEGKECNARNDVEGFTQNMRIAIKCFLDVKLFGDAVRALITIGELAEAAEQWLECKEYSRAAPLFSDAGLHVKAAECQHRLQRYSEAAASLRQGCEYDKLVSYLDEHKESILSGTLRSYSLLCKLLLKQKKVSSENRKHAIELLGSATEQEACFREYEMDEQLAELYTKQRRYKDLYDLFSRTGQLEKALELGLSEDLRQSTGAIAESELLNLIDYVFAGHTKNRGEQRIAAAFKSRSGSFTPSISDRIRQWEISHGIYAGQGANDYQNLADVEATAVKRISTFQKILDATAVQKISKLDDMPFESVQQAIGTAKDLVLKNDKNVLSMIFIITGIWTFSVHQQRYVLLPWSPFYGTLNDISNTDVPQAAIKWVLEKFESTLLALDSRARVLWNSKWPVRCSNHLTTGNCRKRNCLRLHKDLSQEDCLRILEGMLRVNNLFCNLATLYHRRVMGTSFQKNYQSIRRHWLERLLRELTFLSSTEQSSSAIVKAQTELLRGSQFLAVRSAMEGLLYFRLGTEWGNRSDFTSLLEQMQLAEAFGLVVSSRLFRALSQNLHRDRRSAAHKHLCLLNILKLAPDRQSASIFRMNFEAFLRDLDHHKATAFRSLHSFTSVCECLATYLILKTCVAACVVSQSWIDLYRPTLNHATSSTEPLEWNDRYRYQQCLIELLKAFCRVLRRVNEFPSRTPFLCSGRIHETLPLQRRNEELVAILMANIAATTSIPAQVWSSAEEMFATNIVRTIARPKTVNPVNPGEIIQKLAPMLLKHNSKDALVVIIKDRKKGLFFSNIEGHPGVETVPYDHLRPSTSELANANISVDPSPSTSTDAPQEDYTQAEKDAVARIKQMWLSCSPRIKRRRAYVSVPECRAMANLYNISAQCPASATRKDRIAVRKLLVLRGVALLLKLDAAKRLFSTLQQDIMVCIESVEIGQDMNDSVDDISGRKKEVEGLMAKAEDLVSEKTLATIVQTGILTALEYALKTVEGIVGTAEQNMLDMRRMIEAVSGVAADSASK